MNMYQGKINKNNPFGQLYTIRKKINNDPELTVTLTDNGIMQAKLNKRQCVFSLEYIDILLIKSAEYVNRYKALKNQPTNQPIVKK